MSINIGLLKSLVVSFFIFIVAITFTSVEEEEETNKESSYSENRRSKDEQVNIEQLQLSEKTDLGNRIIPKEGEVKNILSALRKIPASEYQHNINLYQVLARYEPDNKLYKDKLDHYNRKMDEKIKRDTLEKEREKQERVQRIAKFGEPPEKSSWDGSYYPVLEYIKNYAHDPDSVKITGCTNLKYTEKGWLVGCDYRARNGFGAIVMQSNWFTIRHDQVVQMHDFNEYTP